MTASGKPFRYFLGIALFPGLGPEQICHSGHLRALLPAHMHRASSLDLAETEHQISHFYVPYSKQEAMVR
jgi:hypothetical protein